MNLPRMFRNLWIYRRLVLLALLLGVVLHFVFTNNQRVQVVFPLLGEISSTSGIVALVSVALGAGISWLVLTFRHAARQARDEREHAAKGPPATGP